MCSLSEDGSHQLAKKESERIGGRYFLTPRGLYQSWNIGIKKSRTPFTYISRVGESNLPEGVAHLLGLIRKVEANLVFSPPLLSSNPEHRRQILRWPVLTNERKLKMFDQKVLPAPLATSIQATGAFSCLLGSFSSCLCRTTFIQSYPFPARFHHYRDTGWFSLNLSRSRLAYSDAAVTDFQIHNAPHPSINPAHPTVFLRAISRRPVRKNNYLLRAASLKFALPKRYLDLKKRRPPKAT